MKVTLLLTGDAATAHGTEMSWGGIASVESSPAELKLHPEDGSAPVVIDREHVLAYNRTEQA